MTDKAQSKIYDRARRAAETADQRAASVRLCTRLARRSANQSERLAVVTE